MSVEDDALVSTKGEPGPFDGFQKAEDGEPIFTLIGRDPDAPACVQLWVDRRRERASKLDAADPKRAAELLQISAAERIGWAMDEYRNAWPEPESDRAYYSGVAPDKEAKEEIDRAKAIKSAHSKLHNALAEANDQLEILKRLGGIDRLALIHLAGGVSLLRSAADEISPKRKNFASPDPSEFAANAD